MPSLNDAWYRHWTLESPDLFSSIVGAERAAATAWTRDFMFPGDFLHYVRTRDAAGSLLIRHYDATVGYPLLELVLAAQDLVLEALYQYLRSVQAVQWAVHYAGDDLVWWAIVRVLLPPGEYDDKAAMQELYFQLFGSSTNYQSPCHWPASNLTEKWEELPPGATPPDTAAELKALLHEHWPTWEVQSIDATNTHGTWRGSIALGSRGSGSAGHPVVAISSAGEPKRKSVFHALARKAHEALILRALSDASVIDPDYRSVHRLHIAEAFRDKVTAIMHDLRAAAWPLVQQALAGTRHSALWFTPGDSSALTEEAMRHFHQQDVLYAWLVERGHNAQDAALASRLAFRPWPRPVRLGLPERPTHPQVAAALAAWSGAIVSAIERRVGGGYGGYPGEVFMDYRIISPTQSATFSFRGSYGSPPSTRPVLQSAGLWRAMWAAKLDVAMGPSTTTA